MRKLLSAVALLVFATMISGCSPEFMESIAATPTPQPEVTTTTPSPSPTPIPTPSPEPETTTVGTYSIGDTAAINNWDVTVSAVEFVAEITTSAFHSYTPDDGNQYLYVMITATNMDSSPRTFLPLFQLRDDIRVDIVYNDTFTFIVN